MKQVFLNPAQVAEVLETDVPRCGPREVLVAAAVSLISTGTETAGYDAGSLLARGVRSPSMVTRLVESLREEGLEATRRKVAAKRADLTPLGYSGAGVVVAVGAEVRGTSPGDRVAYAGAPHAEYVAVNERLVAPMPEGVDFEAAAFGALGCIALHGVRLSEPTLGETAAVVGLGLVGLLAAQCARASGMRVIGIEPIAGRRAAAVALGFGVVLDPSGEESLGRTVLDHTGGIGADVVLLCAGVKDSEVTNQALGYARDRARVVMLGDMGLALDRGPLFGKELDVRVSRSYGPGRYDPAYERKGLDYPIGYVRWTEGRNLVQVLAMLAEGSLAVGPLVTARVPMTEAPAAYRRLVDAPHETIAVVLDYPAKPPEAPRPAPLRRAARAARPGELRIGVIGAGAFVEANLLPHLAGLGARVHAIANRTTAAFARLEALHRPALLTTAPEELLADPAVDAVIVGTRHDTHATLALAALAAGKPVHVEKPLALTLADAEAVRDEAARRDGLLTIGFNRRHAPLVVRLREALAGTGGPRQLLYRVNAPPVPLGHWTLDPTEGGGRLVGEGCHFIDLVCYLADSEVTEVRGGFLGAGAGASPAQDNFALTLRFRNGDLATVVYSGQGNAGLEKERLEIFAGGKALVLDDFTRLTGHGLRLPAGAPAGSDKGFRGHLANFLAAVRGTAPLVTTAQDGVRAAAVIDRLVRGAG
ncbi:MAG TPA: bi-domain-containing oxidoreductase [Gemmatimonadales bacterium]|nr:bi-domain-containing oxidoreductase [Gemmatimonadales bacterium]